MNTDYLFVMGTALLLIGFIGLMKTRFLGVRRRLDSASTIRSRARLGGSAVSTYQSGESFPVQGMSIVVMVLGCAAVVAAVVLT